jgi:hypothetical protein
MDWIHLAQMGTSRAWAVGLREQGGDPSVSVEGV